MKQPIILLSFQLKRWVQYGKEHMTSKQWIQNSNLTFWFFNSELATDTLPKQYTKYNGGKENMTDNVNMNKKLKNTFSVNVLFRSLGHLHWLNKSSSWLCFMSVRCCGMSYVPSETLMLNYFLSSGSSKRQLR